MLPNLTPDLNNASIGNEPIRDCDFTVTISTRDKQFPSLSAAVVEWYLEEEVPDSDLDFIENDDQDHNDDTEYEDEETVLLSLRVRATLNTLQELQELRGLREEDDFELNVSLVYHTATTKRPVFRHTFVGLPMVRSPLSGAQSSSDSVYFKLQLDCTAFSLSIMV
jgi:hypothetical protein